MQGAARKNRKRAPQEFKDKVMAVLEGVGHAESRSAKMSQEDFMSLLAAFNAAGIHFA
jgi:18S rRNA (adenine1779-N6/adenine1780-N6)-dimethyltransferase